MPRFIFPTSSVQDHITVKPSIRMVGPQLIDMAQLALPVSSTLLPCRLTRLDAWPSIFKLQDWCMAEAGLIVLGSVKYLL